MLAIEAKWTQPIELSPDPEANLIYIAKDLDDVPETSGAYIFGRQHGDSVVPIYVGEAGNLRKRLTEHLKNNVSLMKALEKAPNGKRFFICSEVKAKKGQDPVKARQIVQGALIEHSLAEGHELVNKQGTKVPAHTIHFAGNKTSQRLAPRQMLYR